MKRKLVILSILVISLCILAVGVVSAEPADVFIDPGGACGLIGTDRQPVYTTDVVVIETNTDYGNRIVRCIADNPYPPPDKIQIYNYKNTGYAISGPNWPHPTTHWTNVVTPAGKLILTAISHPNAEP